MHVRMRLLLEVSVGISVTVSRTLGGKREGNGMEERAAAENSSVIYI